MVLVLQLLLPSSPVGDAVGDAVEGAVAAPGHTGIREFVDLKETEPQRLGLEEVSGTLLGFQLCSVTAGA